MPVTAALPGTVALPRGMWLRGGVWRGCEALLVWRLELVGSGSRAAGLAVSVSPWVGDVFALEDERCRAFPGRSWSFSEATCPIGPKGTLQWVLETWKELQGFE